MLFAWRYEVFSIEMEVFTFSYMLTTVNDMDMMGSLTDVLSKHKPSITGILYNTVGLL